MSVHIDRLDFARLGRRRRGKKAEERVLLLPRPHDVKITMNADYAEELLRQLRPHVDVKGAWHEIRIDCPVHFTISPKSARQLVAELECWVRPPQKCG